MRARETDRSKSLKRLRTELENLVKIGAMSEPERLRVISEACHKILKRA